MYCFFYVCVGITARTLHHISPTLQQSLPVKRVCIGESVYCVFGCLRKTRFKGKQHISAQYTCKGRRCRRGTKTENASQPKVAPKNRISTKTKTNFCAHTHVGRAFEMFFVHGLLLWKGRRAGLYDLFRRSTWFLARTTQDGGCRIERCEGFVLIVIHKDKAGRTTPQKRGALVYKRLLLTKNAQW